MVRVSSKRFFFKWASVGVLAVIDGLPFTSINHGFRWESIITSKPYNSKHLLSFCIILDVAMRVLMTSS